MRETKKTQLLEAMQTILLEYQEKRHEVSGITCKLCVLYLNREKSCWGCPMSVFGTATFPCQERRCRPVDCRAENRNELIKERLERVVDFYEQVIAYVQTLSNDDLRKKKSFKPLLEIDLKVAKRHVVIPK